MLSVGAPLLNVRLSSTMNSFDMLKSEAIVEFGNSVRIVYAALGTDALVAPFHLQCSEHWIIVMLNRIRRSLL